MNIFTIVIPGILNFLFWFFHLNASHRMSILKFLMIVLTSICPILNIITLAAFIICACVRADDINNCRFYGSNNFFGFGEEYDYDTISGKLIHFFVSDK